MGDTHENPILRWVTVDQYLLKVVELELMQRVDKLVSHIQIAFRQIELSEVESLLTRIQKEI